MITKLNLDNLQNLFCRFLKRCFFYKRDSLEFFNQDYRWLHQDYQNATHLGMSMQEIIDNDKYLIELNGPECFFTFTYGEYGT